MLFGLTPDRTRFDPELQRRDLQFKCSRKRATSREDKAGSSGGEILHHAFQNGRAVVDDNLSLEPRRSPNMPTAIGSFSHRIILPYVRFWRRIARPTVYSFNGALIRGGYHIALYLAKVSSDYFLLNGRPTDGERIALTLFETVRMNVPACERHR